MLLDVEMSVRVPTTDREHVGEAHPERVGEKLGDQSHDVDTGITKGEELVDTGPDKDKDLPMTVSNGPPLPLFLSRGAVL